MPHVTPDTKVYVVVAGFGVNDGLDDGVRVEVGANQVADVPLRPRFEVGVRDRAQVDDERREELSLTEVAVKGRGDLASVDVTVGGAKRIDARVMNLRAVLSDGVAGATGTNGRGRGFVRPEKIVGRAYYHTHVSFVARRVRAKPPSQTILSRCNWKIFGQA
jgi:hypothetical protein